MKMNLKKILLLVGTMATLCAATAHAERLAVLSKIANIRSGPGTQYEVMWQVEKYFPLSILEKHGRWYRFQDFENDIGWIHNSLVGKMPTVISRRPKCNVRSGPGTGNAIVFSVEKGIPFKVLGKKGNWLHVEHADGDSGWIYKTLVW